MRSTSSLLVRTGTSLAAAILLLVPELQAQQTGSVTGRIQDARTGQPVGLVQVFIADLDLGVLTQQDGRYLLLNVPAGTHTVTAQRIGYRVSTAEVSVAAGQTVLQDLTLSEEALQLDEVIVTGTPGGTQRRAIGNSVTQVEASEVTELMAVPTMQDLLSARAPGLDFTRVAGSVGGSSNIQIRGTGSFTLGSQPLIYIDGVRMDNSFSSGPDTNTFLQSGESSVLDDLNPEDIASIEIIKGPAAATLYGTEASAGVIQIITKRGQEGAPEFNLSIRQGVNYMADPTGMVGPRFACRTSPAPPCPSTDDIFKYNTVEELHKYLQPGLVPVPDPGAFGGRFFPWPDDNLWTNGHAQQYNLDVRGGTQSLRYFLSGNYQDDVGSLYYNWDETYRFRANVSAVFSENVSVDVSTGYIQGKGRMADPTYREGGTWVDMLWGNGFYLTRINPTADPRRGGLQERRPDDVADVEALRDYSRFTGSFTLNHTIGDWFTQRTVLGIDKGWERNEVIFPIELEGNTYAQTAAGEHIYGKPTTTNLSFDHAATVRFPVMANLTTSTSVGVQYYAEEREEIELQGFGYASPFSRSIGQTVISQIDLDQSYVEDKSLGVYVQEELGWNDRVFLTGAVRFDDNSAFGSDFDAQVYPKLSATWVVSEESFWSVDFVNALRLRGAWGKAGRQPSTFARTSIYSTRPGPGGSSALYPSSPGNSEVGPEISTELELGFDVAFLEDRVSGEFTWFRQRNEDALLGLALTPSLGTPGSVQRNVGRIDNWGWEATLNARLIDTPNLAFDLALAGDYTMNEIKELGDYPGSSSIALGNPFPNVILPTMVVSADWDPASPIRNAYGQGVSGVCDSGVALGPTEKHGRVPGGALVDCVTEGRNVNLMYGPAFYPYTWSVAPTVSLANNTLQLYAVAEGQYGAVGTVCLEEWSVNYNNSLMSIIETDPTWVLGDRINDLRVKDYYDADFWKLRDVGVRYQLPQSITSRVGADRISMAVSGRNVATLWRAQWDVYGQRIADPEHKALAGVADNCYLQPGLSSFGITFRVTF